MATNVNEGDVWTVRIGYRDERGNRAFNLLQYRVDTITVVGGGIVVSEPMHDVAPTAASELWETFWINWQHSASDRVRLTDVMVQSFFPVPKSRQFLFTCGPLEGKGELVSEGVPLQDAVTLLKKGPGAHRSNLGRIFIPGCPEIGQNTGVLTAGQKTLYDLLCSTFSNLITFDSPGGQTYTLRPVLAHMAPAGLAMVDIFEVVVSDDILKTQRRRRPGKGI